ncbi:methyltransferase domain protein [bacterium BMS3Abin05]|nr:methyltransferase domain protein [bacterium BMS3Abin05]HDZ12524.1 class I SAM-dependent methyltransferase [Bacteroidota bacterium]
MAGERFEAVDCPVCGTKEATFFLKTFDRYVFPYEKKYRLEKCRNCGALYVNPRPVLENQDHYYPIDIHNPFLEFEANHQDFFQKLYAFVHPYAISWKRKQLEKIAGVGRILDVECGNGDFLYAMRRHLWEVMGVERIQKYANFAHRTLGLPVLRSIEDLSGATIDYFDAITFWHSFSRFHDPVAVLEKIYGHLKAEGFLFIAIPNTRSLDFYFYREDWAALDIPRRLFHITPAQMQKLVRRTGWKIINQKQIGLDYFYNALLSEKIRMARILPSRFFSPVRYFRGFLVAWLSRIVGITGNGSGMLYILQKRKL